MIIFVNDVDKSVISDEELLKRAYDVVEVTNSAKEAKFFERLIKSVEKTKNLWSSCSDNFYEE